MSDPLLPFDAWPAGITQPDVPFNNNARREEILARPVISATTTAQPSLSSPADDYKVYIIPAGATGSQWVTFAEGDLAIFIGGTWTAFSPPNGLVKFVMDEDTNWQFKTGDGWAAMDAAAAVWGGITGTLSAQTDLQSALDAKASITYVDGLVQGLSWKKAVRAATTANGILATAFANGQSIDGVTLATNDRILIKNQSTGSENGIYVVNASGAPTRSADADIGAELVNASLYVSEGTANADTQWVCTTNAPITIGSTSIGFVQLSSGGSGDVVGPASATDNALARYDSTTGKLLQDSAVTIGDNGEIAGYIGTINAQTGTAYTLQASDAGKIVTLANASAITLTLPNNLPAGFACTIVQKGAGAVTFTAASGATRNNRSSHTKTAGQWAMCSLYIDSNSGGTSAVYILGGDTAA